MRKTDFEDQNPSHNILRPTVLARKVRSLRFKARVLLNRGTLPNTLIIGAMKCGTTSLFSYLEQHPSVATSRTKEVHYFDNQFAKGERWYRANFEDWPRAIVLESSPYYMFHPLAPARARALAPEARLIAIVRNPVDRAYSHYNQNIEQGLEWLPFDLALAAEESRLAGSHAALKSGRLAHCPNHQTFSYVGKGMYGVQLARWLEHFPREQLLVLKVETMFEDPQGVVDQVTEFLGIAQFAVPDFSAKHQRAYSPMPAPDRSRLEAIFEAPNAEFSQSFGIAW